MSTKSSAIKALVDGCRGQDLDAHYLGYFECFNRQLYFEAHEVLEELWLEVRSGPLGLFYKGLIQLAGAFVHLQRNRPGPAAALFKLADANLGKYPGVCEKLDVQSTRDLIGAWLERIESGGFAQNPLLPGSEPVLRLDR